MKDVATGAEYVGGNDTHPTINPNDQVLDKLLLDNEKGLQMDRLATGDDSWKYDNNNIDELLFKWFGRDVFIDRKDNQGFFIGLGILGFGAMMLVRNELLKRVQGEDDVPCRRGQVQPDICFPYFPKGIRQIWYYALIFLDLCQVGQVAVERTHRTVLAKLDKSGYGAMSSDQDAVTHSVGSVLSMNSGGGPVEDEVWQALTLKDVEGPLCDWRCVRRGGANPETYQEQVSELDKNKVAPLHLSSGSWRREDPLRFRSKKNRRPLYFTINKMTIPNSHLI